MYHVLYPNTADASDWGLVCAMACPEAGIHPL